MTDPNPDTPASLRVAAGYATKTALQADSGLTRQTIASIEAGRDVSLPSLAAYADAVGSTVYSLMRAWERVRKGEATV